MKKLIIIFVITLTIISFIHESKSEYNSSFLVEELPEINNTNVTRESRQDLGDIITGVAASIAGAITQTVVNGVVGNTIISTRQFCYSYGSRRSNRYCDDYCDDFYRRPIRGYCQTALSLCVCECEAIECNRYCRRYDDYDRYDYRRPNGRQGRGYCTNSGCRCD